jgi:hypothetical protein
LKPYGNQRRVEFTEVNFFTILLNVAIFCAYIVVSPTSFSEEWEWTGQFTIKVGRKVGGQLFIMFLPQRVGKATRKLPLYRNRSAKYFIKEVTLRESNA